MPTHILTRPCMGQHGAKVEKTAKPDVSYSGCGEFIKSSPLQPLGLDPWEKLCHEDELIKVAETLK